MKKKYWDNGKLKSEVHYKDGKPERVTGYYASGAKKEESYYKNGEKEGLATRWYINGRKKYTNFKQKSLELQMLKVKGRL